LVFQINSSFFANKIFILLAAGKNKEKLCMVAAVEKTMDNTMDKLDVNDGFIHGFFFWFFPWLNLCIFLWFLVHG